ncbi:MAG: hypothetical protein CVU48_01375 [Candidatus Cloacimonetes bacterium HGW-Cloacimonetes-1]|nr:MAG: hypothetical protein CVU48_01375 [Candidatus Cloacimonetes bacterium HGW-Cloacimonetes-1]
MDRLIEYKQILMKYRLKINAKITLKALILSLMLFIMGLHVYFLLWLNIDIHSRTLVMLNIAVRVCLALTILYLLLVASKQFLSNLKTARWLDLQSPDKDDIYQNVLQLSEQNANPEIVDILSEQALNRIVVNKYVVPPMFNKMHVFGILFLILGTLLVWGWNPDEFGSAFRQFYSNRPEQINYKTSIELSPGNSIVGKNQQVTIQVINPERRLAHKLYYRTDKVWRELALTDNSYIFSSLDNSIEYYVSNAVAKSAVYKIEVLDEPYVKKWRVEYTYPLYTRLKPELDTLSYGNIEAYKFSMVKLFIETNITLQKATLNKADGSTLALQKIDRFNYVTQFQVLKSDTWYLELVDQLNRVSKPEEKSTTIIPDNPPEISIDYPGLDVMLNQNLLLPLVINADDDFGLKNCSLLYQINDQAEQSMLLQSVIVNKLFQLEYLWNMKEMGLFPGDVVTYKAEIYDNSPDNQRGVSSSFRARFPSIEEIYKELEREENSKKEELVTALDKSKQMQKDFEEKRRELLKKEKPNWEDKKQLEDALKTQEKLSEQVDQIAENYQQLIDKMQKNETLSPETLEKMMKIQELMQEISNDELRKAMEKFEDALKSVTPEALKKAMEDFKFSMQDFAKKIEQTLDLLESIKKEQAVQKALQISEEMEKMQKALHDKTGDNKQDSEKLAKEQQAINDKYENLKKELDKIDKMLESPKDDKAKQQLKDLQKEMQKSGIEQNMKKSQSSLQQKDKQGSKQEQEQAMDKMRTFTKKLSEMKSSMASGSQQGVTKALQAAIRELLIFSKNHEETASRYSQNPYPILSDLISNYEGIQITLNKLYAIPQVMMFIPPKFVMDLSTTFQNYRDLFVNISDTQYYKIPENLTNIQKGINLMVYDLMQAMQNQSSGSGSGSGMQSMMQMLEQMGQEQMAMNMLTEQMLQQMQGQGGKSNPAMQQQIQKLANDQQRLADNLKRALQNNPEAQKQGNAVQQIIDEAEAISRQMRTSNITQDLLNRQERILSRLLDAQKSLNKRDMSQKRKGETAELMDWGKNPNSIDYDTLRKNALLDETYRSFPKEYQQVIIQYLKKLNESQNK